MHYLHYTAHKTMGTKLKLESLGRVTLCSQSLYPPSPDNVSGHEALYLCAQQKGISSLAIEHDVL